jgi:hypothetical protein
VIRSGLLLLGLVFFASSAYAASVGMSGVSAAGGTGQVALPTNVVQVEKIMFYHSGSLTTNGQFNQLKLSLTASTSGTYTIYTTVLVNGAFAVSTTNTGVSLSSTATVVTTSTFTTQTQLGNTVEVDVVATA